MITVRCTGDYKSLLSHLLKLFTLTKLTVMDIGTLIHVVATIDAEIKSDRALVDGKLVIVIHQYMLR